MVGRLRGSAASPIATATFEHSDGDGYGEVHAYRIVPLPPPDD